MTSQASTVDNRLPDSMRLNELKLNFKPITSRQESIRPNIRPNKRNNGVASNVDGQ